MTAAGVQEVSAFPRLPDCRLGINGERGGLSLPCIVLQQLLTVAHVMRCHDEIRSSPGLSPSAGDERVAPAIDPDTH